MTSNKLRARLESTTTIRRNLGDMLQIPKPGVAPLSNAKLIKIDMIEPNPGQPRKRFSEESLSELVNSIRTHGILQPLRVRPKGEDRYEIIAGERRWRASQEVGLTEVPCIVEEKSDEEAYLEALVENVVREDLNPLDRANALVELRQKIKAPSWEAVGEAVGLGRRHVYALLGLRSLPEPIQEDLQSGVLNEKHGRALKQLEDNPDLQEQAYREIKRRKLSGNDALAYVKLLKENLNNGETGAPGRTDEPPQVIRLGGSLTTELKRVQKTAAQLPPEAREELSNQLKELRGQIDATLRLLKAAQ